MGFHAVALGLHLGHGEIKALLKLVSREYSIITNNENEEVYIIKLYSDIICDYGSEFEIVEYELSSMIFTYLHNSNIMIGQPHCCTTMIYLGCAGDDLGGQDDPVNIDFSTINDLKNWKTHLETEGRIPHHTRLQMIKNCCS